MRNPEILRRGLDPQTTTQMLLVKPVHVIHFRAMALLVVITPPQVHFAAGPSRGSKPWCSVPSPPRSPIALPLLPPGMEGGGVSQSSIIPVLLPRLPRLGFCAFEGSNSFLMDPSTLLPHPGAKTEKLSPSHNHPCQGEPRSYN